MFFNIKTFFTAHWWVPPLLAVAIALVFAQLFVWLVGLWRNYCYRLFEDKSAERLAHQFPLSTADPSPAEEHRKILSPLLEVAHEAANAAQTSYHHAVVRSAACLAVAFVALAVGMVKQDQSTELLLTWVDAIATFFVLSLFLYGRMANRRWIAARIRTELLRQYQFLSAIFPSVSTEQNIDEIKSEFKLEADAVKACVEEGSVADIVSRMERFWAERRASLEQRALAASDVCSDALMVYLRRRVRRQLGWFIDSRDRLEYVADRRNVLLLGLYCLAVALALMKITLLLGRGNSPISLAFLLLFVIVLSATVTAYYINQNARSLIHRYNTQQRRINEWLKRFEFRWHFEKLPSMTLDLNDKNEIRARILEFEDLMIEEAVDWVHITSHDVIELAP